MASSSRKPKTSSQSLELASEVKIASRLNQGRGSVDILETANRGQKTMSAFENDWSLSDQKPQDVIKKCEGLYTSESDFFSTLVNMKLSYFNAGFRLDEQSRAWLKKKKVTYPWIKLSRQIWKKWLICQNVIAFWQDPEKGELPVITLLPAQSVTYSDRFGKEILKLKIQKDTLSNEDAEGLPPRYVEAIRSGKELVIGEEEGEYFKVLTDGTPGEGLGMPRAKPALLDLATWDLFRRGDFNGAWVRKNIIRHSKKGHEIKSGNLAGQPIHFYKSEFGKKLMKHLASISGFSELTTNFDLEIAFNYLAADFFDKKAQEGTLLRLSRWGGPAAMILNAGETNSLLTTALQSEGVSERQLVGEYLESIFNHESFLSGLGDAPESLTVSWDETIFFDARMAVQWISTAYTNGLASPQTARRMMRLDYAEESRLMKEAGQDKEGVTPVFEAKQGLVAGEGGDNPEVGKPKGAQQA